MQAQIDIATLKAVNLAASNEETRYYLKGVFVQVRAHTVTYVATDGHRLLHAKQDSSEENTLCGDWIIPRDWIKAQKPGKYETCASMTVNADNTLLQFTGTITGMTAHVDGKFPDYARVIPVECSGELAQYDGMQLGVFEKFAKLMSISAPTLHHNGAGPGVLAFGAQGIVGVVMPVRHRDAQYASVLELLTPAELSEVNAAMSLEKAA